jgi:hypothetical protein
VSILAKPRCHAKQFAGAKTFGNHDCPVLNRSQLLLRGRSRYLSGTLSDSSHSSDSDPDSDSDAESDFGVGIGYGLANKILKDSFRRLSKSNRSEDFLLMLTDALFEPIHRSGSL